MSAWACKKQVWTDESWRRKIMCAYAWEKLRGKLLKHTKWQFNITAANWLHLNLVFIVVFCLFLLCSYCVTVASVGLGTFYLFIFIPLQKNHKFSLKCKMATAEQPFQYFIQFLFFLFNFGSDTERKRTKKTRDWADGRKVGAVFLETKLTCDLAARFPLQICAKFKQLVFVKCWNTILFPFQWKRDQKNRNVFSHSHLFLLQILAGDFFR